MRTSFKLSGLVRANSNAVERPMPDEAPVMRTVLPERRLDIWVGMVAVPGGAFGARVRLIDSFLLGTVG